MIAFWFAQGLAALLWIAIFVVLLLVMFLLFVMWAYAKEASCKHEWHTRHKFAHVKSASLMETRCTKCGKVKHD